MAEDVDVVVLGMGPGGSELAGELAAAGLEVVGVEQRLVGGECPFYGCTPSKMMLRAADSLAEARRVPELAGRVSVSPSWTPVADRIRTEATHHWTDAPAADAFTGKGGRLVRGRGILTGPHTVTVDGRDFTARRAIVLNPGTDPAVPPIPGLRGTPFWTNREAVAATQAPESLIVLGGGAIGVEMAQAFARFGTRVSVVEAADGLLPSEEPEAGKLLEEVLRGEGLAVHAGAKAGGVSHRHGTFTVDLGAEALSAGRLLVATGRTSNLDSVGIEVLGLPTEPAFPAIDEYCRIADGVYAIGDVTGKGAFTHISSYQANIVTGHILGEDRGAGDYSAVPHVTFTDPEIGAVGLTEAQAREQGLAARTGYADVASSSRGWIQKCGNAGFIKVVEDADAGHLVGATSAGPDGGEVLSMLTLAVHARIPVSTLRRMIYAFPTYHGAVQTALDNLS